MKANKINYCSTFWSDDTFHYPFATHPESGVKKGLTILSFWTAAAHQPNLGISEMGQLKFWSIGFTKVPL